MLLPVLCFGQWSTQFKRNLTNILLQSYDRDYVIDSLSKEILIDCFITTGEVLQPDFENLIRTNPERAGVIERQLRQSCLVKNKSSFKVCYQRWETLENLSDAQKKLVLKGFATNSPVFGKLPLQAQTYVAKRLFELLKFNYPIGLPSNVDAEVARRVERQLSRELFDKFKIK